MTCKSCGGKNSSIRIDRAGIHITPAKVVKTTATIQQLGSRKLIARTSVSVPANRIDKYRA
jgi:hypothetical protein